MNNISTDVISLTLLAAQSLHPAGAVLNMIWEEFLKVPINKGKLRYLLKRCKRVIGAIDQELARKPGLNVEKSIKQLMRHLHFIQQMMRNLVRLGFMKSLLRRDQISAQIEEAHLRLTDCLTLFQVTAVVDLREHSEELERARIADQEELSSQLAVLERNDAEVLRRFDVLNNQIEAMMAIQSALIKKTDKSAENRILEVALTSLQMHSGKKIPKKLPGWTITAFDVEIDSDGQIGHGGFSTVKKGKWGRLTVAVKELAITTDPKILLKEIEAWSCLRHDHVLPFYGASVVASPPFIVSRYMANGNVLSYLASHPNANRVKIIHEIALGMLYIHGRDVIHGDLKAVNILMDDSTKACIADFGLCKIKQHSSRWTTMADVSEAGAGARTTANGTLRYMSPEALKGTVIKSSDVYSYGMTIYEIFTGIPPFMLVPDAAMYTHISEKHTRLTRPTDPEIINRGLTSSVWMLLWNASAPIAEDRPDFNSICDTTERLVEERQATLDAGCVELEEEKDGSSDDLLDLLGDIAESAATAVDADGDGDWKGNRKDSKSISEPESWLLDKKTHGSTSGGTESPSTSPTRETPVSRPRSTGMEKRELPVSVQPTPGESLAVPAPSYATWGEGRDATIAERRAETRGLTESPQQTLLLPVNQGDYIRLRANTDLQRSTRRRTSGSASPHGNSQNSRLLQRSPRNLSRNELRFSPGPGSNQVISDSVPEEGIPKDVTGRATPRVSETSVSVPVQVSLPRVEKKVLAEEPITFSGGRKSAFMTPKPPRWTPPFRDDSAPNEIFELRDLTGDTFRTQINTTRKSTIGLLPFSGEVTCSVPFVSFSGEELIAVGCSEGLWLGFRSDPKSFYQILALKGITECVMLEEYDLLLILAGRTLSAYQIASMLSQRPGRFREANARFPSREIARDVQFVRVGSLNGHSLVLYAVMEGSNSDFFVLEPIIGTLRERARVANEKDRTVVIGKWFREYRKFSIPSPIFDAVFFKLRLAILTSNGIEAIDLTSMDQKSIIFPQHSDPRISQLVKEVQSCRPIGIFSTKENEFLLCYNEFGLFVNRDGMPDWVRGPIAWKGIADRVACHSQYLVIFGARGIEVRRIKDGDLLQTFPGVGIRCLHDGRGSLATVRCSSSRSGSESEDNVQLPIHGIMKAHNQPDNMAVVQCVFELRLMTEQHQSGSYFSANQLPEARSHSTSPGLT
ncbi:hypothetical protein FRB94_014080 [Tulasnella sp. JGI-2019a]|nr:hypothetical protein FRB94_014080 [Tulasnella sp. JGI-2019a]